MAKNRTGPTALHAAMSARGLNQSELERQLGVSVGTANRWLSGEKRPDLDSAMAIRDLLGVPVDAWRGPAKKARKSAAARAA